MANNDTKDIILKDAIDLFSEKGFDGVSVRDIAGKAQVNLAAINYHFKNKENLFKECLFQCFTRISIGMKKIVEINEGLEIEQMALAMFNYFIRESHTFRTSFRIFLLNSELFPESFETDDAQIGPPGGKMLFGFILKKYPQASQDDILWAVRIIFSLIMHKSLVFTSDCVKKNTQLIQFTKEDFEKDICRMVRVVIADI